MSHKFLLWQPTKPAFKHDSTALEILNNYSKVTVKKEEEQACLPKPTERESSNSAGDEGGILVYDIKAEVVKGDSTQFKAQYSDLPPAYEISESSKGYLDLKAYLMSKKFTPLPEFIAEYKLTVPDDGITLQFDSKFESGNLNKAIKVSEFSYKLVINSDINTYGQNHWYYFSAYNPRKTQINFEILNMLKFDDLYKSGLKPAVYSKKHFEKTGVGWHRDCINIVYKSNKNFIPGRNFYSLGFSYDYRYPADTVYFAYCVPYTHSQLSDFLQYIREKHQKIARVNIMCKTLAGNTCEMITITDNIKTYSPFEEEYHKWGVSSSGRKMLKNKKRRNISKSLGKEPEEDHQEKSGIVLTARVHSGETVSSFMMNGAIEFLLSDTREARILRKKFVFKIVPMLNPDGVRYGNYRCSLIGVDLNRRWEKPSKNLHPTIFYTKKMIEVFSEDHKLMMCCDMHGHSKKRNVFMYGCAMKTMDCLTLRKNLMAKVIPVVMNEKSKFFTFKDCHFRLEKSKMSTERIVIYNQLEIPHSYTIEASFFGPLNKKVESTSYHMTEKDLQSIGEDLCKSCLIFTSQSTYLSKIRWTNNYLRKLMFKRKNKPQKTDSAKSVSSASSVEEEQNTGMQENENLLNPAPLKLEDEKMWDGIEIAEYSESDEEGSGGSDSCPSEKLESPLPKPQLKRRLHKFKKKQNTERIDKIDEEKIEYTQSTNEKNYEEEKQEVLTKTYSLKPQLRAVQSKKGQLKEVSAKSVQPSNLRSQNIMFNYPLPNSINTVPETNIKSLSNNKRVHLLSQEHLNEDLPNVSLIGSSRPLNFSFERNVYKRHERDQSFLNYNKNVFSEFSWSTKPGYIAKNFADSARLRINQMYSKFST